MTSLTGGGDTGLAFKASKANVIEAATKAQADDQYKNTQEALTQQKSFVNAVQAQGGLANQSSVYNQLQGMANGTGPNPAQAMLANSTGQNINQQAALMAGQRGSGANAGMMARQAGMQGANIQQQAAGQAAALQATQSQNALNQMGGLATNQANQLAGATGAYTNATQNEQANILNAINGINSANVGMQSNMNSANAAAVPTIGKGQGDMMGNIMGGAGGAMGMIGKVGGMFGGGAGDTGQAAFGAGETAQQGAGLGGAMGAGSSALAAEGGPVNSLPNENTLAPGASLALPTAQTSSQPTIGPQSKVGQFMSMAPAEPMVAAPKREVAAQGSGGGDMEKQLGDSHNQIHNMFVGDDASSTKNRKEGEKASLQWDWGNAGKGATKGASWGSKVGPWGTVIGGVAGFLGGGASYEAEGGNIQSQGNKVSAMVSKGETYLDPRDVNKVKAGADPLKVGEKIPGKPKFKGNNYANDVVPKTLESGGLVIPNSVMQSKDPHKSAAAFVAAHLAKQGKASLKKSK